MRRLGDFRKCGTMFGVNGATVTIEQACAAQEPCTIPQPGQTDTVVCRHSQQADELISRLQFCPVAAANDQQVQIVNS
ncbi:hypothetical protein D3C86_2040750 [compost metagenome]